MICQGYKAPDVIDPRLLDPKFALEEVDEDDNNTSGQKITSLKKLLTNKVNRSGYAEDNPTLHAACDLTDFILSADPHEYLANFNQVSQKISKYSFYFSKISKI